MRSRTLLALATCTLLGAALPTAARAASIATGGPVSTNFFQAGARIGTTGFGSSNASFSGTAGVDLTGSTTTPEKVRLTSLDLALDDPLSLQIPRASATVNSLRLRLGGGLGQPPAEADVVRKESFGFPFYDFSQVGAVIDLEGTMDYSIPELGLAGTFDFGSVDLIDAAFEGRIFSWRKDQEIVVFVRFSQRIDLGLGPLNPFLDLNGELDLRVENSLAVPEPGSGVLLALGAAGLGAWRRRSRTGCSR